MASLKKLRLFQTGLIRLLGIISETNNITNEQKTGQKLNIRVKCKQSLQTNGFQSVIRTLQVEL